MKWEMGVCCQRWYVELLPEFLRANDLHKVATSTLSTSSNTESV